MHVLEHELPIKLKLGIHEVLEAHAEQDVDVVVDGGEALLRPADRVHDLQQPAPDVIVLAAEKRRIGGDGPEDLMDGDGRGEDERVGAKAADGEFLKKLKLVILLCGYAAAEHLPVLVSRDTSLQKPFHSCEKLAIRRTDVHWCTVNL